MNEGLGLWITLWFVALLSWYAGYLYGKRNRKQTKNECRGSSAKEV